MKKLLLVLLSLVLCVGLCGCGDSSVSNAKKSVEGMMSSLKSGEYDKMTTYMNTGALSLEESLDDMSKEMLDILFSKFDYKIVDATKVSDEEVEVNVQLTNKDMAVALKNYVTQAFTFAFSNAFSETPLSDEEVEVKMTELFKESIEDEKVELKTSDAKVTVVKVDDQWVVKGDESLYNSITGNINKILEDIENSMSE